MRSEWIWAAIAAVTSAAIFSSAAALWFVRAPLGPAERPGSDWIHARMAETGWPEAAETLCEDRPERIETIVPDYPFLAASFGRDGWAIVAYDITEDGRTEHIRVLGSAPSPAFGHAARAAVAQWRFEPPEAPVTGCHATFPFEMAPAPGA